MTRSSPRIWLIIPGLVAATELGCNGVLEPIYDPQVESTGTTGSPGTTGGTGSVGASGAGSEPAARGGQGGTGATAAVGGMGSSSTAGDPGGGTSGVTAYAPTAPGLAGPLLWTFDGGPDGWHIIRVEPPAAAANTRLIWVNSSTTPPNNRIQLEGDFAALDQGRQIWIGTSIPIQDYTGKALSAAVTKITEVDLPGASPPTAQFYAKDSSGAQALSAPISLESKGYYDYRPLLDLTIPAEKDATFNPATVVEIGVLLTTGSVGQYVNGSIQVDTVEVTPSASQSN